MASSIVRKADPVHPGGGVIGQQPASGRGADGLPDVDAGTVQCDRARRQRGRERHQSRLLRRIGREAAQAPGYQQQRQPDERDAQRPQQQAQRDQRGGDQHHARRPHAIDVRLTSMLPTRPQAPNQAHMRPSSVAFGAQLSA